MHYVSTVLGIRDPIHKQKIALKAMDVVLFGPPRGRFKNISKVIILYGPTNICIFFLSFYR